MVSCSQAGDYGSSSDAKTVTTTRECVAYFQSGCIDSNRISQVCDALVTEKPVLDIPLVPDDSKVDWNALTDEEQLLHYARALFWAKQPQEWAAFEQQRRAEYSAASLSPATHLNNLTGLFLSTWKDLTAEIDRRLPAGDSRMLNTNPVLDATRSMVGSYQLAIQITSALSQYAQRYRSRQFELRAGISRDLRVVEIEKVLPHEYNDPARVDALLQHLDDTNTWANPIIVSHDESRDVYVVMDGATRTGALKKVGAPHAIVQVVSSAAGFRLGTWHHVIPYVPEDLFLTELTKLELSELKGIAQVPRINPQVQNSAPSFAGDAIAFIELSPDQAREAGQFGSFKVVPRNNASALDALNELVGLYNTVVKDYIQSSEVTLRLSAVGRTVAASFVRAQSDFPDITALILHKPLVVEDLYTAVANGQLVPAGITRSQLSENESEGRILNLGIPFSWLKDTEQSLQAKRDALQGPNALNLSQKKITTYGPKHTVCEETGPRFYSEALRVLQPMASPVFTYEDHVDELVYCD